MLVHVHVAPNDIALGQPRDGWACPIALATLRALKRTRGVLVEDEMITAGDMWCRTPPEAREFLHHFDNDEPVAPIDLTLDLEPVASLDEYSEFYGLDDP